MAKVKILPQSMIKGNSNNKISNKNHWYSHFASYLTNNLFGIRYQVESIDSVDVWNVCSLWVFLGPYLKEMEGGKKEKKERKKKVL